jgi:hypothetical protein
MGRKMGAVLVMCKKHPYYQVKRKPTSQCEQCWIMWLLKYTDPTREVSHDHT